MPVECANIPNSMQHRPHISFVASKYTLTPSSQCQRVSVKTGKKGKKKLRCRHEAIVSLFYTEEEDEFEPATEKTCTNCFKVYREAGGQCKFCVTAVTYCSRKCQVRIRFLQSIQW